MGTLKLRELGVLIVELLFGVVEGLLDKISGVLSLRLAIVRILFEKHRSNFGADLLSQLAVVEGNVYIEAWNLPVLSSRHRFERSDFHRGAQAVHQVFHVRSAAKIRV